MEEGFDPNTLRGTGRRAPLAHLLRMLIEAPLNFLQDMLVLPARDASLATCRAAVLDGAGQTVGPSQEYRDRHSRPKMELCWRGLLPSANVSPHQAGPREEVDGGRRN